MAFDYKKEYKEFYLPPRTPGIVTVPAMNFLAVRGQGDPNEEGGAYKQALGMLYAVAFTIKMSRLGKHRLEGYVKGLGLRDDVYEAHVTKQLTDAGLQFDDAGKLIGGDDIVRKFRESHPGAFLDTKPEARVVASTMHHEPAANSVEAAFYAKNPGLAPRD